MTSRSLLLSLLSMSILTSVACKSGGQSTGSAPATPVAPGAQPVLVSKQFSFTEGPAVDKAGNIFFTDQPNDKIWKYDTEGKLSLFLDKTGRANGLYFDRKGQLIACADANNELWSITPEGKSTILMDNYQGKKMNGPNDLWIDKTNGIFFTDPYYQRDYWTRKTPELDKMHVYYLAAGTRTPVVVADSFARPNGIVGSKDGKIMYVADIGAGKIYKYTVEKDARLTNRTLFASQTADGITLDNQGNLYAAGNGVTVYNPKGEKIQHIPIPEKWTANLCFGGPKRDVLFITASTAVYTLQMQVKGIE
ncbi:SMP-30/gluconolactonase/LRE family protein [Paraflavitalea sp. CAU 1676]|uniref:SMP-30/gluconolactonase/LRE family protein n=1 Tax=Paraflavitalea sp. CAU 1676 TaxID=3032598 RepID=UPI0023DA6051|nr:SMP-30/gluconolactonase/LRE family protein [Paraflavitalea sp. CAU 1676]MDF2190407.1 SMP-30/gluconolactonase/LRE family protein [Paraflavitalea sp. CAU 1676]